MNGVIIVNKKKDISSFVVVNKLKRLTGEKCGHLGTLDPLASGVLPICVGRATRLFDYYLNKTKTYEAEFTFGTQTTTLDLEGDVEKTCDYTPSFEEIKKAIKDNFLGEIDQLPPKFSAKKINGKRACDIVRSGKEVDLKPCKVTIYDFTPYKTESEKTFRFSITCSAGTYIRSLARDLGLATNSCATMTSLKRVRCGEFDIKNAVDLENLTAENVTEYLLPLEKFLTFEKTEITSEELKTLLDGKKLPRNLAGEGIYSVLCEGKIVGIGVIENGLLKIKTYLL